MKIGLAQINPTVGDFAGNSQRILTAYSKAVDLGAQVVVTPELCLTGYPPRDLVHRSRFVPANLEALEAIAAQVGETPLLVGCVQFNEHVRGKPFRNSAAILHRGAVAAFRHKSLLPTYDVFDEDRYFEPADAMQKLEIAGMRFGITICEDIWTDDYLPRPLYAVQPAQQLARQEIDVLLNLSASPFHLGKAPMRERMLAAEARALGVPIVYCNAVGGNDQLVFDGNSVVINAKGEVLARLAAFAEETAVVTLEEGAPVLGPSTRCDAQDLHDALVLGLRDYVQKCGFKSCVLGLSGGIDSALTAVLAAEALGPENVLGISLPSVYSSQGSKDDARDLAQHLGIRYETVGKTG